MRLKTTKVKISFYLFCLLFVLITVILLSKYPSHLEAIRNSCDWSFEEAIHKRNVKLVDNMHEIKIRGTKEEIYKIRLERFEENEIEYDHYEDSILYFTESDEWEYRTQILSVGSYVGRKVKRKDILTDYLIHESFLYLTGEVDIELIIEKYREILSNRNIIISKPIHITVTSDIHNPNMFNIADRINIKYNHVTPIIQTGYLDEIMYQAFIYIPFITVYKGIAGNWLNFLYGVLLTLLIFTIYLYVEEVLEKRKKDIIYYGDKCYKIGHLLFRHDKRILTYKHEQHKMTPRMADIILAILENEDYSITKDNLIDMLTSQSNVTSFIHKIKELLNDSGCIYQLNFNRKTATYRLEMRNDKDNKESTTTPATTTPSNDID